MSTTNVNVNVNYKAIEARKFVSEKNLQTVQISSKSTLTTITKMENGLAIGFVFTSNYEPNVGYIRIEGDVFVATSPEEVNKAMLEWESSESKHLPQEMAEVVHNSIISNCIMETAFISREIKLPPPFPVPHVLLGKEQKGQMIQPTETINSDATRYIQ